MTLQELKANLLADSVIDAAEVAQLKEFIYADGAIDKEEAEFLFELNDAVSGNCNDETWNAFFIQAISDYLLKDPESPGEIDSEEAAWLEAKIGADGRVDGIEKALLESLKAEAKAFPKNLVALLK